MNDAQQLRMQQEQAPLMALRYEDAADGAPPLMVAPQSFADVPSPPRSSRGLHSIVSGSSPKRPRTSPGPRADSKSPLPYEAKRDSGVAPSVGNSSRLSYAESPLTANNGGAAREPTLPTIVVQHEESSSPVERSRSPFGKRRSQERPVPVQAKPPSPTKHKRLESFHGIDTLIPTGALDDFDLEDLASDKVGFSHRGSMLFGGQKMNALLAGEAEGPPRVNGFMSLAATVQEPIGQAQEPVKDPLQGDIPPTSGEHTQDLGVAVATQESGHDLAQATPQPRGLRAGRREPSIQMLQAALQGGRVLSAEEMTFSMKVRSMYEAGDERAADWTGSNGFASHSPQPESSDSSARNSTTPDVMTNGVVVPRTRQPASPNSHIMRASNVRASYYSKETNELAGGIEDWDDINGQDVDRYGFINPMRTASRGSEGSQGNREPLQRVATSLRASSRRPRRERVLRRKPSMAGSSRSMPPRPSGDLTVRRGPGSVHSTISHAPSSRSSVFMSRDRRTLAEASDMLTLPPGLAAIAEHEDAGRTASLQKQREWAREEKWQKMARPIKGTGNGKGGGMRFEFDTTDSKLISRTWKGIPDRWRATAWHSFLAASAKKRNSHTSDEELIGQYHKLQEENSADDVQIDVDVPRTVSMHIMFRRRYRGGQRLLFRVLHAVSLYFPDTGYVQGMASLAATFLCYYEEEHAFVMMVRLWQLRGLEQLFQAGFGGLMTALGEFETRWLRDGDVAQQLQKLGISSTAYGTRWYLTLFNMSMPFPAQLRVWDVFMLLGDLPGHAVGEFGGADLDVLHATSAALVDATREILLDSDFENAMKVLTSFVPIKDEDLLMRVTRAEWTLHKKRRGRV